MKELPLTFEGKGEMKGYVFTQLIKGEKAYIYRAYHQEEDIEHYEVFERKENAYFQCISYPKSHHFGQWAWCILTKEKALEKYNLIEA